MSKRNPKSEAVSTRVTPETKRQFIEKAAQFEPLTPADVLRELVIGFVEDRVTIIPPSDKKESIYNVPRNEN